jgi:5-methyltetrahydrofolate--homocysteine methyltransferase
MGPTGELLEPMGNMTYKQAVKAFAEQARGLIAGGADILWIETMSDLDEVRAAYEGARQASADIPVCATMSFDTSARTMMGVSAAAAVEALSGLDLTAIGANCGNNMPDTENVLIEMRALNPDIALIAKSNAGMPQWVGEDLVYDGTPEVMGGYAHRMKEAGVQLIGGCCGSTPEHVALMKQVVHGEIPVPEAMPTAEATIVNQQMVGRKRRPRRRG